jgi:hypothetical protein
MGKSLADKIVIVIVPAAPSSRLVVSAEFPGIIRAARLVTSL